MLLKQPPSLHPMSQLYRFIRAVLTGHGRLDCHSGKHTSMQIWKMLIAALYLQRRHAVAVLYSVVGAPQQVSCGLFLQTGAGVISLLTSTHP